MKQVFLVLFFVGLLGSVSAQKTWLTVFAGSSNYQGELQEKSFTYDESHFTGGIGLSYDITPQLSATVQYKMGKLSGDDAKSQKARQRNLNFSTSLNELSLGLEYALLNLNQHRITPYVFGGVAIFHFNPYTNDSLGNRFFLQSLGTEGQGINGKKKYALTQFAIPLGAGVKFAINSDIRIGVEVGIRKTFTDYLDDVSSRYIDKNLLAENNGNKAVELAFRSGELKNGAIYPEAGTLRGNAKTNDMYYFTGISLSFRLGGDKIMGRGFKSSTGCPTNF